MKKTIVITDKDRKNFEIDFNRAKATNKVINILLDWEELEFWISGCDRRDRDYDLCHQVIYLNDYDDENITAGEVLFDYIESFNDYASEISEDGNEYSIEIK